jgi:hypothetical protein
MLPHASGWGTHDSRLLIYPERLMGPHDRRADFDALALFEALDTQREQRGLSWSKVAQQIWELSANLNARRSDHPISPATIIGVGKRGDTSCQHALFMLRWLDRTPESFLRRSMTVAAGTLPAAGPDHRLRWNLHESPRYRAPGLYEAMNARRESEGLTWPELARRLRCSPNQLSGLRTARYAVRMTLAMRITQWLQRPAADFIYAADW